MLARHVERYTAKNSFDYFIHKDLGGFLRRELDLYLKSEVLNVDDLTPGDAERLRRALARMRAVRHVGGEDRRLPWRSSRTSRSACGSRRSSCWKRSGA